MEATQTTENVQYGAQVKTIWSSQVTISHIICTASAAPFTFYGVLTRNLDRVLDSSQTEDELLWVYNNGTSVSVWQETRQRPLAIEGLTEYEIKGIVGHYELENGRLFYAVKWFERDCPTWELEDDLSTHNALLLHYWTSLLYHNSSPTTHV